LFICLDTESHERNFLNIAAAIVILSAVIQMIFEVFEFLTSRGWYLLGFNNWIEWCLHLVSIIFVSYGFDSDCVCPESWQWQLGAVSVFLAWVELVILLKDSPNIGIYIVMFFVITRTLAKVIMLVVLLVLSFGFAFYMIFFRPVSECCIKLYS